MASAANVTSVDMSQPIDGLSVVSKWTSSLQTASDSKDANSLHSLFLQDGWLRDLMCFDWEFHSLSGSSNIVKYLTEPSSDGSTRFARAALSNIQIETAGTLGPPSVADVPGKTNIPGVQFAFTFTLEAPRRLGRGFARLAQDMGEWKAFTLLTTLTDLKGHEEPPERPLGVYDGHTKTWTEVNRARVKAVEDDPTVLIVGGGQTGVMCAARFERMGIRTLVVEKSARVGDVWRQRYESLTLHTFAHANSFLYHPWPRTYPTYIPRDILADFLESYATGQNIVIWLSSTVLSEPHPTFDDETKKWTVRVERAYRHGDGEVFKEIVTVQPKHIVMATGIGKPNIPAWPGMDTFGGVVYHSDQHTNGKRWRGKKAIVIGAGNAGADVALSFWAAGASTVTIVQRSPSCFITSSAADIAINSVFKLAEEVPIDDTDLVNASMPNHLLLKLAAEGGTARLKEHDKDIIQALEKRGFLMTWETSKDSGEVGFIGFALDKLGGAILDVGCAQHIINGDISIKSGVEINGFDQTGLIFSDGTHLEADVVVLATGYRPIISDATSLLGTGVAAKVGNKVWGIDEEGELLNAWRPTGQKGLWFAIGGFPHARFYSKHLALHILAEELGLK